MNQEHGPETGKMRFRRHYYNLFSTFYDGFIRLHSRDAGEAMRSFLAETARLDPDCRVVDLCTGTGSSALRMAQEDEVRVVGVDFSEGMLRQARTKTLRGPPCFWIRADVTCLPIAAFSVDRVTCTYAMYELSGEAREKVLQETERILKPGGMFVMMEHLPPDRPLIKLLYLIRIYVLGTRGVRSFAGNEEKELGRFFDRIGTVTAPGGRTKAVYGFKPT
jgi:demethylmenaquinone methyltransferase/2-methoxy-6-polyprenyl-1,4-benzoquinol methylase